MSDHTIVVIWVIKIFLYSLSVYSCHLILLSSASVRFQGISSDRVLEELWLDVRDIVHEAVIKTIPEKKNCKKAKWLSEEALQIAEKRREAKGKGEKERYTHLNAAFQRIARRDKEAFLSDQCKEIEENNRMGRLEIEN